jgi:hypothetical protein
MSDDPLDKYEQWLRDPETMAGADDWLDALVADLSTKHAPEGEPWTTAQIHVWLMHAAGGSSGWEHVNLATAKAQLDALTLLAASAIQRLVATGEAEP